MARKSIYSPHPSMAITIKWVKDLPEKTGRSLDEWKAFINKKGPATEKERVAWLKNDLKLGTNTAHWLAVHSLGGGAEDLDPKEYLKKADEWVAEMCGKKPMLEPLYWDVIALVQTLGKDVKICPCKTMVAFYRNNVFAKVTFSTKTRLDLGLCLRGVPFTNRLTDTGGTAKKDRITHNIAILSKDDVDAEAADWLLKAYEMDA
jgi:Domain of unknown function (DUF5655)/Domain of unknown function (DUF4287)